MREENTHSRILLSVFTGICVTQKTLKLALRAVDNTTRQMELVVKEPPAFELHY